MCDKDNLDTIERWDSRDPSARWQNIKVKGCKLKERLFPLLAPLNDTEIVIMYEDSSDDESDDDGDSSGEHGQLKNCIHVLNTVTNECT